MRPGHLAFLVVILLATTTAAAESSLFAARLTGLEQVPPVLTEGGARLELKIDPDARRVGFRLSYEALHDRPIAATINFGQPSVVGAPVVVLCSTPILIFPPEAPAGPIPVVPVPRCPAETEGIVAGSFDERRVFTAPEQGVDFNDFDALVKVLESGSAYIALTSLRFPAGELRGQISQLGR